jgi:hypothetical protein
MIYRLCLTMVMAQAWQRCPSQVGEFYETMGCDAVLLVEYAGLNPMGNSDLPRAGCPIQNLLRTLRDLVEGAGLSVVRLLAWWRDLRLLSAALVRCRSSAEVNCLLIELRTAGDMVREWGSHSLRSVL